MIAPRRRIAEPFFGRWQVGLRPLSFVPVTGDAALAHATAASAHLPPTALWPGEVLPRPFISSTGSSFRSFRTRLSSNQGLSTSPPRPQAPSTLPAFPVIPDHPRPRRSHPCTTRSKKPPAIWGGRHQLAARELFPISGRHRHFRRRSFFNEPQPNSPRREHPWAFPYRLPSLTWAVVFSRSLPTLELLGSPQASVASPSPAASSSPRHLGESRYP